MWNTRFQIAYDSNGNVFMALAPAHPSDMECHDTLQYVDANGNIYRLYGDGGSLTIKHEITTVFPAPPTKDDVLKSSSEGSYTRFFSDGSIEQRYSGGALQKWGPIVECRIPSSWMFVQPCKMCGDYCNNCKPCQDAYADSAYDFYD